MQKSAHVNSAPWVYTSAIAGFYRHQKLHAKNVRRPVQETHACAQRVCTQQQSGGYAAGCCPRQVGVRGRLHLFCMREEVRELRFWHLCAVAIDEKDVCDFIWLDARDAARATRGVGITGGPEKRSCVF